MAVAPWVQQLTEEVLGGPPVEVGKSYQHPEHGVITIISGQYWGKNGLSNHWRWRDAEGNEHSGYADDWPEVTA